KYKFFLFLLFFLFFLFPSNTIAQEKIKDIGFLTKNIWYSKTPFFDGDSIRIYTIVNNSTKEDVIGKITFYDNKKIIGSNNFSMISGGPGAIVWIDWQVSTGEHFILAEINEAKIAKKDGTFVNITLENSHSSVDSLDVDIDTDKDGIGNKEDQDDDNDGMSDKEEIALGLDPLNPDSDNDGVKDSIDTKPKDPNISKEIPILKQEILKPDSLKLETEKDETKDSIDAKPEDSNIFKEIYSTYKSSGFIPSIKKSQEKIIPLIKKVPQEIDSFLEKKEEALKLKVEEKNKIPEIKKTKEIKKRIFSFEKEKREDGISQFKKLIEGKKEKKEIAGWLFSDFLIFVLEKRIIIFYSSLVLFFLFLLKYIKNRR
ncbi:thrombospondin type 3 repeat-containing protein, partial [Patescibacteria group bacterium]|nr:thrombospondin type 3 repeat-containing protein [Patescibacteria group bacterium]